MERLEILDVPTLAELLEDAAKAHQQFEQARGAPNKEWAGWYAEYILNALTGDEHG